MAESNIGPDQLPPKYDDSSGYVNWLGCAMLVIAFIIGFALGRAL